jgi:hypothetical protein
LEAADGLKGIGKVLDFWLRLIGGPAHRQDIEAGGMAQEPVPLQEDQGQIGQAPLFVKIHGFHRRNRILAFSGTHFDENETLAVKRNEIQFAAWAREISAENSIA